MLMFDREPVLWLTAASAVVNLCVGFGLGWTAEQVSLVNVAIAAVVGLIARSRVTPIPPGE